MKALVVAPQPFFSARGTPFSVYYRTRAMGRAGEEVDLLTYGQGGDVELPRTRIIRTPALAWLGGVRTGPSWLKLLHDCFILIYTIRLLLRNDYDYVLGHEEGAFIARMLKPIFGFKLVYDMHSSLPEQLSNFDFSRSSLLTRLFESAERSTLRCADAIIVVYPTLLERVRASVTDPDKVVLIENSQFDEVVTGSSTPAAPTNPVLQQARQLAVDGYRLIVYAGTLEPYQGIDLLLEGFKLLAQQGSTSYLLIIGGEPGQIAQFETRARELDIAERCLFSGKVSHGAAASCNEIASVYVSPRSGGTNTPMKIYAQMSCGVPLLATRVESHTQVLTDAVAELVAPTPQGIAEGIRNVLDCPARAAEKALAARRLFEQNYSEAYYTAKMRAVITLLASEQPRATPNSQSAK